jgi:hypothetical protein
MDDAKTVMVFRVWPDGEVLALMPEEPADNFGYLCSSYTHIGQHGGATYDLCISLTRPATPAERLPLKRELRLRGYDIDTCERAPRNAASIRHARARAASAGRYIATD